jgi:ATP-dependent Clp protease protease subunit
MLFKTQTQGENMDMEGGGDYREGITGVLGFVHTFYIYDLKSPENYTGVFEKIRNSSDCDRIIIRINSFGGNLMTALQFMRSLMETKAQVTVSVEGACMSAATFFLMVADEVQVTDHSLFMFHNYSAGHVGKGGEMWDAVFHERSWSVTLLSDIYRGFFTEDEINDMLNNRDIWLSGHDVVTRVQARKEMLAKEQEAFQEQQANELRKAITESVTPPTAEVLTDMPPNPHTTPEKTPRTRRTKKKETEDVQV